MINLPQRSSDGFLCFWNRWATLALTKQFLFHWSIEYFLLFLPHFPIAVIGNDLLAHGRIHDSLQRGAWCTVLASRDYFSLNGRRKCFLLAPHFRVALVTNDILSIVQ
eukprot:1264875-Amorphochlora_amoeboformis.AAC.1